MGHSPDFWASFCRDIAIIVQKQMKWNESGFRPPLWTYRLNWARRTSWGWWDEWDDTVLQTQDSKFEPWRSEAEHATSRSRRLPTILIFTRGWGRNIFVSFKPPRPGTEPRTLAWREGGGANHYPSVPALLCRSVWRKEIFTHSLCSIVITAFLRYRSHNLTISHSLV